MSLPPAQVMRTCNSMLFFLMQKWTSRCCGDCGENIKISPMLTPVIVCKFILFYLPPSLQLKCRDGCAEY